MPSFSAISASLSKLFMSSYMNAEMYDNINSKLYSGLVTLDLTKAFDAVCHKRLLKLDHYGIKGIALELISSYLTKISQLVCINNVNSECKTTLMGVPQGLVLGSPLFLIYCISMTWNTQ